MKKHIGLMALVACVLLVTSCTSLSQSIPGKDLPLVRAGYTILGETTASAEGMFLMGALNVSDFKSNFNYIGASIGNPSLASLSGLLALLPNAPSGKLTADALYKALKQLPEADALLEPKITVEQKNYLIVNTVKVTVKARGIKYTQGAQTK